MHPSCAQALHGPEAIAGMHRLPQARHYARQERSGCPLAAQGTLHRPCRGGTPQHPFRSGAAAGAAAHGQPELSEELPEEDASRAILEEIAAEDAQVAAQDAGAPVFDLFPQKAAPLSPKQQRERAAKLTGRPLRAPAASRRRTRCSADLLDARQQGDIGSMGALAKALDVRPQRPLAPVPHLEPVAAQQAQLDTASPYVPRQDGIEGIGSYAQKLAKAGLDLSANPREVVYNHPMAAMARLDAAIAAGYDPDAEFRSMLGRLMTDDELEDAAELDDDGSVPKAQEGQPESMTPDLDAEFNEQLSEEERRDEQGMMNPEWDADMDVMDDEEEDSLADNFDRALSETMAAKEDNDREGFAVWEGDEEEIEDGDDMASIDDIVGRLTKSRAGGGTGKEQKKPDLKKPQFSWRDFGPGSRPVRRPD